MIKISEEDKEIIIEYIKSGYTQTNIAEVFGVSQARICQIVREEEEKEGIKLTSHERGFKKKTELDGTDLDILEGLKNGLSHTQIGKIVGLTKRRVGQKVQRIEKITGMTFPRNKGGLKEKTELDDIDKEIIKYLGEKLTQQKIGEIVGLSGGAVTQRKKKIIRIINTKLAKEIVKLVSTRRATIEQIRIMGEYYGVDVEEAIQTLKFEENER